MQTEHEPHVQTGKSSRLFILYLFFFSLCLSWRVQNLCKSVLGGNLNNESLFGLKIPIATSNKNNSSLLMWLPWETRPHTSARTNWSNCCSATPRSSTHTLPAFSFLISSIQPSRLQHTARNFVNLSLRSLFVLLSTLDLTPVEALY